MLPIKVEAVQQKLPTGWFVTGPTLSLVERSWKALQRHPSAWSQEAFPTRESLTLYLASLPLLIETPFGLLYASDLVAGWRVRVHGIFWSRDLFAALDPLRDLVRALPTLLGIRRVECSVLGELRGIGRLLERLGFSFEGTLRLGEVLGTATLCDVSKYGLIV